MSEFNNKLSIKKVRDNAIIPTYGSPGASGFDLYATNSVDLYPGQRALIYTGWMFQLPKGFELQVRPRSGLALKNGITVLNSPGTVDSDYRGEVGIILINHGREVFRVQEGDRVAQGVIAAVCDQKVFNVVTEDDIVTERGADGYGSTGTK